MTEPSAAVPSADPCAPARARMQQACGEAAATRAAFEASQATAIEARRRLAAARGTLESAQAAADTRRRLDEKARLHDTYRSALSVATTSVQRQDASARWAREIDRLNRASRRARGMLASARAQVASLEESLRAAEASERAARVSAEAAQAACMEARGQLAACEGGTTGTRIGGGPRLVIEALMWGDPAVLAGAAADLGRQLGRPPHECGMRLRDLRDTLAATASARGYVEFDRRYGLWSRLSQEEAHDVLRGLADMGFTIDPVIGWRDHRAPVAGDLAAAIAYAGIDPRTVRNPPGTEELRAMPRSIRVDPVAMLATEAPDLSFEGMVRLLGDRTAAFPDLLEAWGQVRVILLKPLEPRPMTAPPA